MRMHFTGDATSLVLTVLLSYMMNYFLQPALLNNTPKDPIVSTIRLKNPIQRLMLQMYSICDGTVNTGRKVHQHTHNC